MKSFISFGIVGAICAVSLLAPSVGIARPAAAKATVTYAHDVAPILNAHCITCHKGTHPPKGLNLTTYKLIMKGASGGVKVVKPGHAATSLLYTVLKGHPVQMPPSGAIAAGKITTIQKWINQGAKKQ